MLLYWCARIKGKQNMVQESKLLKTILSRQAGCKSELTYNFVHKTQNMLSILHFIIDDLVEGENVVKAGTDAKELLSKYGIFLNNLKSYCHENGRLRKSCILKDAVDFAINFKKIHLREQKIQIENKIDEFTSVPVSPFEFAYALDELLPMLADTQSTQTLVFSVKQVEGKQVMLIQCIPSLIDIESMRVQLAKMILERCNCIMETESDGIAIHFGD